MDMQGNSITKLCSFYVSDWHLVTMLLPYVNQKINEQAEIEIILENDIKEKVKILIEKLNLKNKEKILNLNWKKSENIKNKIGKIKTNQEFVIFINGSKDFINKQNRKLEKDLANYCVRNPIKIINCYEVLDFDGSIEEVLDQHDKVLNTSGEKEITEVFKQYEKKNPTPSKAVVGLE